MLARPDPGTLVRYTGGTTSYLATGAVYPVAEDQSGFQTRPAGTVLLDTAPGERIYAPLSMLERATSGEWKDPLLEAAYADQFTDDRELENMRSASGWTTKDSGQHEAYDSGMVRDTEKGKPRFDLMWPVGIPYDQQFMTRIAGLLARGAEKYGDRNWEKGTGQAELDRAISSASRHFAQWVAGERDEDHAAAVFFNLLQAETLRSKMEEQHART